ncbi:MAG: endolytic transglycosylase MltG [Treponema sp.]|uniref:endolytic transglycosylase MltG n=1 Tax=Treponema sp. TaxID=166 RepID=UPI00298E6425|nr:endolytic transglycosylase MltG [Treponema sp.]MBR5934414.1 endolytic transglycosylase MltG [Treponema sp.]
MTKKNILKIIVISAAIIIVAGVTAFFSYFSINSKPANPDGELLTVEFEVTSGMTAKTVGNELKNAGLIKNERVFYIFARFPKFASFMTHKDARIFRVQKGIYTLDNKMSLSRVFEEVCTGKVREITVSIPEGLTLKKIAKRISATGIVTEEDFIYTATHDAQKIFSSFGINLKVDSVEGFLYPDTYNIPVNYNSYQIISMMVENLGKQIKSHEETQNYLNDNTDPDEFFKMITLASIIEREYRDKEEAPLIGGVFYNRLKINMPLQSCATVEYIITEIRGRPHPHTIYYEDLEMKEPYNTYIYPGLPPGPISNPGFTAINAAINPQDSDYLYFTLTDADAGRHTFSTNFDSHAKATAEFKTKKVAGN